MVVQLRATMATSDVKQQIERLLDESTGPTVAVIVQAREDDRATKAHATAAAAALAERRLTVRSGDVLPDLTAALARRDATRSRRGGPTPSVGAVGAPGPGQPGRHQGGGPLHAATRPRGARHQDGHGPGG